MVKKREIVICNNLDIGEHEQVEVVQISQLKSWIKNLKIVQYILRFSSSTLYTYDSDLIQRAVFLMLLVRLLSYNKAYIRDTSGTVTKLSYVIIGKLIIKRLYMSVVEFFTKYLLFNKVKNEIERYSNKVRHNTQLNKELSPLYLRTDLVFGLKSGGSVTHISGVLNHLQRFFKSPIFVTSDSIPLVNSKIKTSVIKPDTKYLGNKDLPQLYYNFYLKKKILSIYDLSGISFMYQRYSINNFTGAMLAKDYSLPFVLEYNGSEVWCSKYWGDSVKHEKLSLQIEMLNLQIADLIVVVSEPLHDELRDRGVDDNKILVNPNGVDPDRYNPSLDGSLIKQMYQLQDRLVIGFIGTFGQWHGAEILAEAVNLLVDEHPHLRSAIKVLMVGDGITKPHVENIIHTYALHDIFVLTGRVPQKAGPGYLAACDILASPHVPNADGSKFFGSPTKLFEYMAMGKGIVASDLDQIGEVLEHKKTAYLTTPGDVQSFADGLKALINDENLRNKLGSKARKCVVENYTWRQHTKKIIDKLQHLYAK